MNQFFEMDRRQWLANAFMLVGATATAGCDFASLGSAKGGLDEKQLALLNALADVIMPATDTPGAVGAGVPKTLNGMLGTWASADSRKMIVEALGRVDAAARVAHKKGFAEITEAERNAVLKIHDAASLNPVTPPPGAPKGNIFAPALYVVDDGYLKLKGLILSLYYSSEIGGTKELVYEHVPGPWQPSIKVTDKTRPWANAGPF